jgi:hypothetical protein
LQAEKERVHPCKRLSPVLTISSESCCIEDCSSNEHKCDVLDLT